MRLLRNIPIKRKIMLVILITSWVAIFVTAGALFAFQVITFRQTFTRDLSALGEVIANHSTAAVALNDKDAATEMLGALKVKPHIVYAQIQLTDGSVFARYVQASETGKIARAAGPQMGLQSRHMSFVKSIVLDNEEIGKLLLRSDYEKEFSQLLRLYLGLLAVVLSVSILLTYFLSSRLQRVISEPILNLAEMARVVAEKKDYSVRVPIREQDEIGQFAEAFNQMLGQIQAQNEALRLSWQKFETLVHSIEGIVWEAEPVEHRFIFVSQQAERLLGYPTQQWLDHMTFWEDRLHPDDRATVLAKFRQNVAQLKPFALEFRMVATDGREVWVRNSTAIMIESGRPTLLRGVMLDITERKKAEKELEELHQQLITTSRQAGMAEIATGVLHNVGNVLNSVNVSATLIQDSVRESKVSSLGRTIALLHEQGPRLGEFLTADPKGKLVPAFLTKLGDHLQVEQEQLLRELSILTKNVGHIKEVVAMQQSYARVSGMVESLPPSQLVEDAIRINAGGLDRHRIEILRDFADVPSVAVDKHKVLQILINLIGNAKHAVSENNRPEKRIRLVLRQAESGRVAIAVHDNGIGIAAGNLTRVFQHGFTTKSDGHGFGLHSSANAAKEMGGSLVARSEGLGHGATFELELPTVNDRQSSVCTTIPETKTDVSW